MANLDGTWRSRSPLSVHRGPPTGQSARSASGALTLVFGVLVMVGCSERDQGFDIPTARYVSPTYGFSVAYPDTMDVREHTPERISIGFAAGDGFDPRVEIAVESDTAENFESLLERKALDSCFAESPDVLLSCRRAERRGTVRAATREKGTVLHLTLQVADSTGTAVDSMPRGPYIGFELSSPAERPTVLFVRAPTTRQLWETDVELVVNVARSLEIEE